MKDIIVRKVNDVKFTFDKNKPTIYVIAGIVGVAVGAALTCKAVPKAKKILEEHEDNIESIHKAKELLIDSDENNETIDYSYDIQDYRKDLVGEYTRTGILLAKTMVPPVALTFTSAYLVLHGHGILRSRYAALSAAFTNLQNDYKRYRERVEAECGEETEKKFFHDIYTEEEVDEKGKKKKVNVVKNAPASPYAKFFDAASREWQKDPELNLLFLKSIQHQCNELLKIKGHLTLNEVYSMLDIPETTEGIVIGWIDNPDKFGIVDFGIYEPRNARFVNGYENVILLDFNVTGNIYEIEKSRERLRKIKEKTPSLITK